MGLIEPPMHDTTPVQESVFSCTGVSLQLGGRQILDDIALSVRAGEVLGLAGPNGAGKTSLFEVLCGRYKPERGKVRWAAATSPAQAVRPRPPRPRPHLPAAGGAEPLTVAETLGVARKAYRPYPVGAPDRVGGEQRPAARADDCPAGALETLKRRKLMLACLLIRRPRVMLLDEPAAGLIGAEIDEIDSIIRHFARQMNTA